VNPNYRPDIDGLRSVAVLSVVLFHSGVAPMSGGYVGVDVFFVISGFLITTIVAREVDDGSFSLRRFYERRIRRIAPALFCVLVVVGVLSYLLLLPSQFRQVPSSIAGAVLFTSNIIFYLQSGYFAPAAETKPLLHTWSLGVEEQYYIFFPLMLMAIVRFAPRLRIPAILLAALLSFVLCVLITPKHPSAAFYLLPARAWELFVGSLLAFGLFPQVANRTAREVIAGTGLLLIIVAVFLFDEKTQFPGYLAMLPVAGSAMVIHSAVGTVTGRLLSTRPAVFIGLISYSLYLWHWPIIVFARAAGLHVPALVITAASVAVASLSLRYIEKPVRELPWFTSHRLFVGSGVASAAILTLAAVMYVQDGFPDRFSGKVVAFDDAAKDISPRRSDCHINLPGYQSREACVLGADVPATVAVWGDSHGVELSYALGEIGSRQQWSVREHTASACPPSTDFNSKERPRCAVHNARVLAELVSTPEIHSVVLTLFYGNLGYEDPAMGNGLLKSAQRLRAAGKRVILLAPIPKPEASVPLYLAQLVQHGAVGALPAIERKTFDRQVAERAVLLRAMQTMGVDIVSPGDLLCDAAACNLERGGKPLYFDDNHLSMTGARLVATAVGLRVASTPADQARFMPATVTDRSPVANAVAAPHR
jgi:peptidoglycan/LPS O-acetylase OafA/YrhL